MICHCTRMLLQLATLLLWRIAWGQKKRLFISFSLINEANEKKSLFRKKSNTMEAFKKTKKNSLGWKFARYGGDFNTETKNLESHVKTYSCELYVCVRKKKFEFREVSHTHGIFQLLLLKLLLRFFKRGKLVKKSCWKKWSFLTRLLLLLWRTRRTIL